MEYIPAQEQFRWYLTARGKCLRLKPTVAEHLYPGAIDCTDMPDSELMALAEKRRAEAQQQPRLCWKCNTTVLKPGERTCDYCRYSCDLELGGKLPYERAGQR